MATPCRIGVLNEDGSIRSIYCNYDGYEKGVGQMLASHYHDPEKIKALIALGDISSLQERLAPNPGEFHSFDHPIRGITIAYGRDRLVSNSENFNGAHYNSSIDEYINSLYKWSYKYLFVKESWWILLNDNTWKPIEY